MTKLSPDQQRFLDELLPAARRLHEHTGLPVAVVLAQAVLESDWGRSQLARRNNNLFGIKAHRSTAAVVYTTTEYEGKRPRRVKARFARYLTYDDCLADYARVLSRPRYRPAREVAADPFEFAGRLQRCGYATDPRYAAKLRRLMHKYDLTRLDRPLPAGGPASD